MKDNKNILSEYEIGEGFLEIQCCCGDIQSATMFYNLANKYLKDKYIEETKININKYFDFCQILNYNGNINLNIYNQAFQDLICFYKTYYNLKENEIKLLLKVNIEKRKDEQSLLDKEFQEIMKDKQKYSKNYNNY